MLRIRLSFRIGNAEYAVVNFDDTNIAPQSTSNINRWTENKKKFKWHSISRVDISGDRQNTPRSQNHDGRCKFNFKHTHARHTSHSASNVSGVRTNERTSRQCFLIYIQPKTEKSKTEQNQRKMLRNSLPSFGSALSTCDAFRIGFAFYFRLSAAAAAA